MGSTKGPSRKLPFCIMLKSTAKIGGDWELLPVIKPSNVLESKKYRKRPRKISILIATHSKL
jgi:hypothetical protein